MRLVLLTEGEVAADCSVELDFEVSAEDREHIRWYWEDYLDYPAGEARDVATYTERRLEKIGEGLFEAAFATPAAAALWEKVSARLADARVEIISPPAEGSEDLPWELLRERSSRRWLAAECESFVRRAAFTPGEALFKPDKARRLRVLAVICRPSRLGDIAFRPDFQELARRLSARQVEWEILRPPTFGKLTSTLLEAEAFGEPYHVVHFDGVALAADLSAEEQEETPQPRYAQNAAPAGVAGYLALHHAQDSSRLRLVDSTALAEALGEARTPILVLSNCCELRETSANAAAKRRAEIQEGFHRLADELSAFGVAAVVESPYCLDPSAVAGWFETFYAELGEGRTVGSAATAARRKAQRDAQRSIAFDAVRRVDWCEPIVHETVPFQPLSPLEGQRFEKPYVERERPPLDPLMPDPEQPGQVRRADLEADLDRMFQSNSTVLLHGPQGSGKTSAASGFAVWLTGSGGLGGPVLYSSLHLHRSLVSLLDQLAAHFEEALESNGLQWERMQPEERLDTALYILNQIPVLWIWDGLETVEGPEGSGLDPWSFEQKELLKEFLESVTETQGRFLLLSRREEEWLGKRVQRLRTGEWSARERLQLVRSVLTECGAPTAGLEQWDPIVSFGRGNPLVTRLLVREALHEGLRSKEQLEELARRVFETGGALVGGDAAEDPATAALSYVLFNGFSDAEQDVLALLHLFRTTVDVKLLARMTSSPQPWALRELQPQIERLGSREEESPLDRARDFGLLGSLASGVYRVEPCAEEPLRALFERRFPVTVRPSLGASSGLSGRRSASGRSISDRLGAASKALPTGVIARALRTSDLQTLEKDASEVDLAVEDEPAEQKAATAGEERTTRAFVGALGEFGHAVADAVEADEEDVPPQLQWNESNLRQACRAARERGWWNEIVGPVRGLGALYLVAGRTSVWQDLTEELAPYCLDPATRGPLPKRDTFWRAVIEQRIQLAMKQQVFSWAGELQKAAMSWDRAQVEAYLQRPVEELDAVQLRAVRHLADSLFRTSAIARNDSRPLYKVENEAVELAERLGDAQKASDWCYELGANYTEIRGIRDLARAERWLRRGAETLPPHAPERARFLAALGLVAWERFRTARATDRPESELIRHLTDARQYYLRAVEHDAADDFASLASHNLQYGHASYSMGDIDRALPHYREAIRFDQLQGNTFGAAKTRFNLAIALRDVGRLGEARRYAVAAFGELRKVSGPISEDLLDRARRLVLSLEELIEQKRKKRTRNGKAAPAADRW